MKRSWLKFVACFVSVAFETFFTSAMADTRGGGSHRSTGSVQTTMQSRGLGGAQFNSVRKVSLNGPNSGNLSPKISKPIVPIKTPGGPIVGPIGPIKPPGGPIIGPVGPIKPPGGPIVGPIGPIGPIKPPGGPIVGPVNPPIGPIGPIGPIKPPGGGGGGGGQPPGGGGGGGGKPGDSGKHCWPPIVLGCVPCHGGYYGCYYPPVYTQTVVVPATTSVVVAETPLASAESAEKLPQVPVGSIVTLEAKDLGTSGQVLLVVDKLTLGMQINEWTDDHATAIVPLLGIAGPTAAELVVVRADGYAASSVKVELVPAKSPVTDAVEFTVQTR